MSRLILPSGRTYENLCVGCDRFHQECCAAVARTPLARIGLDPIPDALSSLPPAHSVFWPRSVAHARSGCLHRPRRPSLRRRPATHRSATGQPPGRPPSNPASCCKPKPPLPGSTLLRLQPRQRLFRLPPTNAGVLRQAWLSVSSSPRSASAPPSSSRNPPPPDRLPRPPRYWSAAGAKRSPRLPHREPEELPAGRRIPRIRVREAPWPKATSCAPRIRAHHALGQQRQADSERARVLLYREMGESKFPDARLADPLELKDDRLLLADIEQAVQRRAEFSSPAPRSIAPAPLSSSNRPTPAPTTTCFRLQTHRRPDTTRRCPDRSALPQPQSGQHRIRRRRHKDRRATSPPPKPSSAPRSPPPTSNTKCAAARSPISSAASANRPPKPPHRTSRLPPRRRRSPPPARRRTSPHRN